jgi:hypothetical protein
MRAHRLGSIALWLWGAVLPGMVGAEPVPDDVSCGTGYWFTLREPEGWQMDWEGSGNTLSMRFTPPARIFGGADAAMQFDLVLGPNETSRDVQVDVEAALQRRTDLMGAFGAPKQIRPLRVQHETLPTAGETLIFERGSAYVASIDVRSGRGTYFIATLTKRHGTASAAQLALFLDTIASIDFDPRRSCAPGKGGELVMVALPGPALDAPEIAPPAGSAFDAARAASGCATLVELFVPVTCQPTEIRGEPALLVHFANDDGPKSAAIHLKHFTQRVAVPFCYEATLHPEGAAELVFVAEGSPQAHVYDCQARDFGAEIPASELR